MNIFNAENLSRNLGDRTLFQDLSFGLDQGDKAALVAPNGAGKSTLLKIIAGKEPADGGQVVFRQGVKVGYLAQDPQFPGATLVGDLVYSSGNMLLQAIREYEEATLAQEKDFSQQTQDRFSRAMENMENLQAWDHERKLREMLTRFEVFMPERRIDSLSGGQKKRLALALLLLDDPDFLLLDEPTNHLDVGMIEWLEDYLGRSGITLLMVTHDRYFLDRVCDQILELDDASIYNHPGNYSAFLESKAEREQVEKTELDRNRQLLKHELEWMRRMPKARTTKSKSRIDSFYDLKERSKGKGKEDALNLGMKMSRLGNKILELEKVSKSFGDKVILKDFTYTFRKGERIGVVGENGTGKSTFLNMLTGLVKPDAGEISTGETVVFGYYTQSGIKVNEDKRVIDVVKDIAEVITMADGKTVSASQFLQHFMFAPSRQYTMVSKLSGGEKRRLYLLTVIVKNPNFLILDEPTNDLDLLTLNKLEEFLLGFPGCLIVVSHDRYFLDKLADQLFIFQGAGEVKGFTGFYSEYRMLAAEEEKEKRSAPSPVQKVVEVPVEENPAPQGEKKKLSFKEKHEFETLEKDIPMLETKKTALELKLSQESEYEKLQEVSAELEKLSNELEEKTLRWIELSELI